MCRSALDLSGLTDAGRWENLIEQVLASPPPYRAAPGRPVDVIHAGDRAALVAEQDLTGPLAGLVEVILETGRASIAAERAGWCRSDCDEPPDAARSQPPAAARRRRPVPRHAPGMTTRATDSRKSEQMQIRARISADGYVTTPFVSGQRAAPKTWGHRRCETMSMTTPHRGKTS